MGTTTTQFYDILAQLQNTLTSDSSCISSNSGDSSWCRNGSDSGSGSGSGSKISTDGSSGSGSGRGIGNENGNVIGRLR